MDWTNKHNDQEIIRWCWTERKNKKHQDRKKVLERQTWKNWRMDRWWGGGGELMKSLRRTGKNGENLTHNRDTMWNNAAVHDTQWADTNRRSPVNLFFLKNKGSVSLKNCDSLWLYPTSSSILNAAWWELCGLQMRGSIIDLSTLIFVRLWFILLSVSVFVLSFTNTNWPSALHTQTIIILSFPTSCPICPSCPLLPPSPLSHYIIEQLSFRYEYYIFLLNNRKDVCEKSADIGRKGLAVLGSPHLHI